MKCRNCGSENTQVITETTSTQKGYDPALGCCGWVCFAHPLGLLCGLCGADSQTTTRHYWICNNCGKKFRA